MSKAKHIHLIGICGTAMASLAGMLKERGYRVTGSDAAAYPPMSDFLHALDIPVAQPFNEKNLDPRPDLVVIGNAMGVGKKVIANLHSAINHNMSQQHGIRADLDIMPDHYIRPDMRIRTNPRAVVNNRRRMHAWRVAHRRMEEFQRPRKREIGIFRAQHRARNSREVQSNDDSRSAGSPRRRRILRIGDEGKFPRPSLFNPVQPGNFSVRSPVFQTYVECRSNFRKFHGSGVMHVNRTPVSKQLLAGSEHKKVQSFR